MADKDMASQAPGQDDALVIDLSALFRKLLNNWKTLLLWGVIAVVLGLVVAFSIPSEYTVKSTLAPEIAAKGTAGNLGSLASLAGINLSPGSSDAFSPDLYPEIIASKPFQVELAATPVSFYNKRNPDGVDTDFYTYLKDYTRVPWWIEPVIWVKGLVSRKMEGVAGGVASLDPAALTRDQSEIIKMLNKSVGLDIDKRTGMITVRVSTQSPFVSTQISQAVIDNLISYLVAYRTEKARANLAYYESLYDEAKTDYFNAQKAYARYVDAHHNVVLASVRTEQERLQNEMNLKYQLYNSCAQQLQMAKAKLQEDTPVCQVIDPPSVPNRRSKPSRAMILVLFAFLGAVAAGIRILWGSESR